MIPGPEHPAAIRLFDYACALALGATSALCAWWVVPDALPGIVAMVLGMAVGFVAALPLFALLNWILGGFELVMMAMQISMLAGMAAPMIRGGTPGSVALAGAGVGFVVQLLLHALDRALHGEVEPETTA
jgi:hypothetical protein